MGIDFSLSGTELKAVISKMAEEDRLLTSAEVEEKVVTEIAKIDTPAFDGSYHDGTTYRLDVAGTTTKLLGADGIGGVTVDATKTEIFNPGSVDAVLQTSESTGLRIGDGKAKNDNHNNVATVGTTLGCWADGGPGLCPFDAPTTVDRPAVAGKVYYSPDQHGGIWGAVRRVYFTSGPYYSGYTIATPSITRIVEYGGIFNGVHVFGGITSDGVNQIRLDKETNLVRVYTTGGWYVDSGWIDYVA